MTMPLLQSLHRYPPPLRGAQPEDANPVLTQGGTYQIWAMKMSSATWDEKNQKIIGKFMNYFTFQ